MVHIAFPSDAEGDVPVTGENQLGIGLGSYIYIMMNFGSVLKAQCSAVLEDDASFYQKLFSSQ